MAEKTFKGRPVVAGTVSAQALVSHGGFNTLASYQQPLSLKTVSYTHLRAHETPEHGVWRRYL